MTALTTAEIREMDRLQDVLRGSPQGTCEMLLPALGFEHPDAALARLREDRALDIASVPCFAPHERGTTPHRRFVFHWRPRARQLETGIAR